MSESKAPKPETREKTTEELKELAAGWEQTLDAIETELNEKNESQGSEEE